MDLQTSQVLFYNMKKIITIVLVLITLSLIKPNSASAEQRSAHTSAKIATATTVTQNNDMRAKILKDFLEERNSPLADYADVFVKNADKYNLDWRFVAAISGTESSFGIAYPQGTYNGWGWGIYGNNMHYFSSWEDAIETISKGLREQYMDKWGAQDIYGIGKFYAASPAWANHTVYFMNKIDEFALRNPEDTLFLSL
ncbi:MAG: hypothetical protein COX78_00345 [Candidatus Levybacteria bacterium CG_4_10_14_0_2_um_filter_35_8]|nr:MAG: hypothetical protein COX78_00345 [Candidatus Levybacteria bacterium CG_4_10_14_0_2_um_filter_35_8]